MSTLSVQHWNSQVKMDPYCIEELYFWKNNLNSIKVRECFLFNKPQRFAYSDASATGCGSVITPNEDCVCVTSFGSIRSALKALLGESLQPLIFP